jgi:hypothetical protein
MDDLSDSPVGLEMEKILHTPLRLSLSERSRMSSPTSMSSFYSDLPPETPPVQLNGSMIVPPNFKKPLLPSPSNSRCQLKLVPEKGGREESSLIRLPRVEPIDSSLILHNNSGIPPSHFSVGFCLKEGISSPIPMGAGVTQGIDLSIHLGVSPSPGFQRLDSTGFICSRDSSGSNNSMIAKNLLMKAKNVWFSFKLGDALEESRLVALEEKDGAKKNGKESRSGVK